MVPLAEPKKLMIRGYNMDIWVHATDYKSNLKYLNYTTRYFDFFSWENCEANKNRYVVQMPSVAFMNTYFI